MTWSLLFTNSILLGVSLALDAFSVSVADAISMPQMKRNKKVLIAFVFALFQFIMPLLGWICIKTIADHFLLFQKAIPYIALVLLLYIGIKMILETKKDEEEKAFSSLTASILLLQGFATSIDALSVGFAIASYNLYEALSASLIIGLVTYIICRLGLELGKKVGSVFSKKAEICGGIILILIGIEIFIRGVFF